MAPSLWSGTISLGLASVPVRMFSATVETTQKKGSGCRRRARKAS
ncbi:MAG TPA: hypothetical protein VK287_05425 [Gaiellaceae bacterium]|nr:hypothetical protein [Gaiellaceae bacterium]